MNAQIRKSPVARSADALRLLALGWMIGGAVSVQAAEVSIAQTPLFLSQAVNPQVMLNLSNDNQLYFHAYDNYTDRTGDGQLNTTYLHSLDYFGYFDAYKCYTYVAVPGEFQPVGETENKYCDDVADAEWSGNFLNWVTMARIDTVRKTLYGGYRAVDTPERTVLERTHLPNDAHSWVRHYTGSDLARLTPFAAPEATTTGSLAALSVPTGTRNDTSSRRTFTTTWNASQVQVGDQLTISATTAPSTVMEGVVLSRSSIGTIEVQITGSSGSGTYSSWELVNETRRGVSLCNTTVSSIRESQNATAPPLMRVASGDYRLWTANERWQCRWENERRRTAPNGMRVGGENFSNGNNLTASGLPSNAENPIRADVGLGLADYAVKVEVCKAGLVGTENCKVYAGGSVKPVGLLQRFGEDDRLEFGLMSGSYSRNLSGGTLRKNVGSFANEVNPVTGQFQVPALGGSIVRSIDALRLFGYDHGDGLYSGAGDNCGVGVRKDQMTDGRCMNWGNPQAEMFLESLRYFAGQSPDPNFNVTGTDRLTGLTSAAWDPQLTEANFCAPLNIVNFNASISSFDGNQLSGVADLHGIASVDTWTDGVGDGEGITGNTWFAGGSNALCTAEIVNRLSDVTGICPEAPNQNGTFQIAGLAHYAYTQSIRNDIENSSGDPADIHVKTYGVALSSAVPRIDIPRPGGGEPAVRILPACDNNSTTDGGLRCALADFQVIDQDLAAGTGRFFIQWDVHEWGSDFDMDINGTLSYVIDANSISITTETWADSSSRSTGFGYILSGTSQDGYHAHSGINNYQYVDPTGVLGCGGTSGNTCSLAAPATTVTYTLGGGTAQLLRDPMYYAAKWGGFDKSQGDTDPTRATALWDTTGDGLPDNYFFAVDPQELEEGLKEAFLSVVVTSASAASVATNSTRLDADSAIYQARFSSDKWSGELLAFGITATGAVATEPLWNAADRLDAQVPSARRILSVRDLAITADAAGTRTSAGINFFWGELDDGQRAALRQGLDADDLAAGLDEARLLYLRGNRASERTPADQSLPFRARDSALGDIVNSNPQFVGTRDFGYGLLGPATDSFADDRFPVGTGAAYDTFRNANADRVPMVVVGANGGMLHGFDARVDAANIANGGRELFAYVPAGVFENLHELTDPDYNHRYFVDGVPRVADAWLGGTLGWRTVVAGTTGAGGRTIFMLDVTTPEDMTPTNVLWEFRHPRLGVTVGQPSIVPLPNGRFGVIVSSGYNNASSGRVFVLDAENGTLIREFDTGQTTAGMASPLVLDTNGDTIADRIYVGDMEGRMWRFDMSGNNEGNWRPPNGLRSGSNPVPLFVARGPGGDVQPISSQPEAGRGPDGNIMVFFGTGTFFLNADNVIDVDPEVQSFYAVVDRAEPVANRSGMTEQEVLIEVQDSGQSLRVISDNELTGNDGWYMDLLWKESRDGPGAIGERVTQRAILRAGRIIFTTVIPSSNACDFGGDSWLIELNAFTGTRIARPVFDLDGDGQFDDADMITVTIDGNEVRVAPSGLMPEGTGILSQPTIVSAGEREFKFLSGSTGRIEAVTERGADGFGRQSWREMR